MAICSCRPSSPTRKTNLAFRLLADASPLHRFSSLISQTNSSVSIFRPTSSSFNLSLDHWVAFFSFQCQLFGFVAGKNHSHREDLSVCSCSYHPVDLRQSTVDHLFPILPSDIQRIAYVCDCLPKTAGLSETERARGKERSNADVCLMSGGYNDQWRTI